jgi:hypothetical protein
MLTNQIALNFELPILRISNNRCSIKVTDTDAFIQGFHYLAQLIECGSVISYTKPLTQPNITHLGKNYPNLLDYTIDTREYNQQFWNAVYHAGNSKYSVLITLNGNTDLIHFEDPDFLNGLITLNNWIAVSNRLDFKINSVHSNSKLCRTYITHGDKVDQKAVKDELVKYVILDLVNIIIDYNICKCDNKTFTFEPIHCETSYDLTENICRSCSTETLESPVRARVRLEVIKDNP